MSHWMIFVISMEDIGGNYDLEDKANKYFERVMTSI